MIKFEVTYCYESDPRTVHEQKAIINILQMERFTVMAVLDTQKVLLHNKGKKGVLISAWKDSPLEKYTVAVGVYELIDYLRREGLCQI